ncbi:AI-2E family transporter [Persicimonas caeni]|uniref:AI-2E family transporter n=1 Tax=Persicimonas caeni TaxID=2292766 RepID=A0A4Y6PQP1_PERCE|nr:AI-2E family transporter [Persicimonas caeni]QDG50429.1 AI-2E family transporter [Persicimonas caeni]QED31650.1 AI-2E family transporter [Persicimonas caeni]
MESPAGRQPQDPPPQPDEVDRELNFFHEVHVIRGAILLLAFGMGVAILNYASVILIPVVLAVFLAYVLNPFVSALMRLRIPRTEIFMPRGLASLIVVIFAVGLTVALGILIGDQFGSFAADIARYEDQIADNVKNLQTRLQEWQGRIEGYMEPIRRSQLPGEASGVAGAGAVAPPDASPLPVESQKSLLEQTSELWLRASSYIAGGLSGLLGFLAQALTCIFVMLFMLIEAPSIRHKLINIMGTTDQRRDMVLEVLYNVNRDVQRYLFNRFATNSVLALVAMLCYWVYGLNYVLLLGILAGLFNFVPYVGPVVGSVFPALVAYIQFGTIESVFWVLVIYTALTGIEGNILTPVVLGRHLKLNSLAVILGLVFWGWLWGAIGMLLAIPIMAAIKAVALHVDDMRPIAELLRAD